MGRRCSTGIQTKKPEMQALKTATHTLTEKTYFLTSPQMYLRKGILCCGQPNPTRSLFPNLLILILIPLSSSQKTGRAARSDTMAPQDEAGNPTPIGSHRPGKGFALNVHWLGIFSSNSSMTAHLGHVDLHPLEQKRRGPWWHTGKWYLQLSPSASSQPWPTHVLF